MPLPTVDDMLARFPALEGNDELIEACLQEAIEQIDLARWSETDGRRAIMYLAAHLTQSELDGGADSGASGNIASESMGPISVSYRDASATKTAGYGSTLYGQRFEELLRANFSGPIIAGGEP